MVRYLFCAAALILPMSAVQAEEKPDRDSPEAIRCVKIAQTGSLVKKTKICRTNAEWARVSVGEKRDAQDFVERHRAGMTSN